MMLEPITAPLLKGTRHAFFSRRGGVSSGVYASLNCGPGSGDQADAVRINRERAARALQAAPAMLRSVHQHHSADVAIATDIPWGQRPMADAMVTTAPGVALGVLTADCAPILFADPVSEVIGAAHAGWKGALAGVAEATIDAMVRIGAERRNILAAIGPTISQRAYEVGPEFLDRFTADDAASDRFFAGGRGDRMHFDLPGYLLARLRATGIAEAAWTGHCTFSEPMRFFSFRRATQARETDYGRLISIIVI
jgi:YfiH family protein